MTANYDSSTVGVPYVRSTQVIINWPDSIDGLPKAIFSQCNAVILADNTVRNLDTIQTIEIPLDLANNENNPIPLVNPTTGAALGANTTLNTVMVQILAVIRQAQIASGQ